MAKTNLMRLLRLLRNLESQRLLAFWQRKQIVILVSGNRDLDEIADRQFAGDVYQVVSRVRIRQMRS